MEGCYNHQFSCHIVGDILEKDILGRASMLCVPKQFLHKECCKIAENIQSSIIKVSQASPDRSPNFFTKEQSEIKSIMDPNIKKIGYQSRSQIIPLKPIIKKPISRKSRRSILVSQNFLQSIKKINFLSSNKKLTNQLQVKQSNKRLLPCLSAHENENKQEINLRISNKKSKLAQEEQRTDETIKVLRQNKLSSNIIYSYSVDRHVVATKRDEIKKIKDNQPKNCFMISTDYDGNAVPLNKYQINKQIPHYIDIQISLPEEELEISKIKPHTFISEKENGLKKQYANYKEIKFGDQQDRFVCSIINKVKEKNVSDSFLDPSKSQQQRISKQITPIEFIGKDNKPIRVGFDLFEKLKKGTCASLLQKTKQQKKCSKNNMSNSIIKKSTLRKKQSQISIQFQSFNQTLIQRKKKRKQSVCVGSPAAVNFLLNDDQRKFKKVVTIDEQFL